MKAINTIFVLIILTLQLNAQLSTPKPEAVYGGRINAMDVIPISSTTTRLFISTESANSIFYADMITAGSSSPSFTPFTVMPGVGDDDGYGSGIRKIAAHKGSGYLFFITSNGDVVKSKPSTSTVDLIDANYATGLQIFNFSDSLSYIYFTEGDSLKYGTLDITGNFSEDANSPLNVGYNFGESGIFASPENNKIFIANTRDTLVVYESTDNFDSLKSTTTFSLVNTSSLIATGLFWRAFGIGPDGTLFIGGDDSLHKTVAYSTDNGVSWNVVPTGINGVSGSSFAFPGTGSSYPVYFAKGYSAFSSSSGFTTWQEFGNLGFETHPNDGSVFGDPLNSQIIYFTTDQGIGSTIDGGATIFEIDEGVEAVQVQDFDMDSAKTTGWTASKSGIRRVSNYSSSPSWSYAMFPNGDGSPYFSAEMIGNDTNSAYVGNLRVYKTNNAGATWTKVFTAENAPYNFSNIGPSIQAIEVCPWDTNLVMVGYDIQGTDQGGLFYSTDGGSNWEQLLLKSSSVGNDADVWDIVFTREDSNTIAYISVFYDLGIPTIGDRARSIYRAEWDGTTWSVRQDMDGAYTSVGYPITASVFDLEVSSTRDTVFAIGTDAGVNHPMAYYKVLSGTNLWTPFTTSGFPTSGTEGRAITLGTDTVYAAVDNEIYLYDLTAGSSWSLGYAYPTGTEINVLYFDDLLVGTGTGLYNQYGQGTVSVNDNSELPQKFELYQNYPNPFNPSTVIEYSLPVRQAGIQIGSSDALFVQLKIYDILGREIATLVNEKQNSGNYKINFNAIELSSGIYFYQIKTNNFSKTKKMILLR